MIQIFGTILIRAAIEVVIHRRLILPLLALRCGEHALGAIWIGPGDEIELAGVDELSDRIYLAIILQQTHNRLQRQFAAKQVIAF